jgi:hypothetical protein
MAAIAATEHNRIDGAAACIASWKDFASAAKIHHREESDPVIHVYGSSAVVAYYFDMSFDMGGQAINMGGRDMFLLVKENGKWLAVADQFFPYPA